MADAKTDNGDGNDIPDFLKHLELPPDATAPEGDIGIETVAPLSEEDASDSTDAPGAGDTDIDLGDVEDDLGLYSADFPRFPEPGDPDKLERLVVRIEEGFKTGDRLVIDGLELSENQETGDIEISGTGIHVEGGEFDEKSRSLSLTGLAPSQTYDAVVSAISLSSIEADDKLGKRILRITATDGTGTKWDAPLLILDVS